MKILIVVKIATYSKKTLTLPDGENHIFVAKTPQKAPIAELHYVTLRSDEKLQRVFIKLKQEKITLSS